MTRARFFVALSLGLALALGCRKKPAPVERTVPSAKPAKSAAAFEPEPDEVAAFEGPAPSGKSPVEREQAVIALLRGQRPANRFPVIATDDGGAVNPALRETLSPRTFIPTADRSPRGSGPDSDRSSPPRAR